MRLLPASTLTPRSIPWLWLAWLAPGKLAILDGDPGLGKSFLALDLCARLSTGRRWPDGSPGAAPAAAVYLGEEDDSADTVVPRLQALGADLGRVLVLHREDDSAAAPLLLPRDLARLDAALAGTGARLLVIDPLMAFLDPGVVVASDQSVRRALGALRGLAVKYDCAVLLIRHLNKCERAPSLYRGGGSIGLAAACRSVWQVGRDPADAGRCVLAQVKANVNAARPSLAYAVEAPEGGAPVLTWLGESPLSAEDLLAAARGRLSRERRDRACEFLLDFLRDGPRTTAALWQAALKEGLYRRTLFRARREVGIESTRVWEEGRPVVYWHLAGQRVRAPHLGEMDAMLQDLHERWSATDPLADAHDDDFGRGGDPDDGDED